MNYKHFENEMDSPYDVKISIVTPVLNCVETIRDTIESVMQQSYQNFEYIIVDGGSTDGTLEVIQEYKNKIHLITGVDKSIADAMNKGMRKATGSTIGILNADDIYLTDTLLEVNKYYKKYPHAVLHGDMRVFSSAERYYDVIAPDEPSFLRGMVINHPTMFIPRCILEEFGEYDETFRINGDWEICIRYFLNKVEFKRINKIMTHYKIGGVSTTNPSVVFNEMHKVRKKYHLYKIVDFRYLREKILMAIFGNKVTKISHEKRIILYKIQNLYKS
jgi:glycosyltransferase involved in cell wall biosynthesis